MKCTCKMCDPTRTSRVADLATRMIQMAREYSAYHSMVHKVEPDEIMDDVFAAMAGAAGNFVTAGVDEAECRQMLASMISRVQLAAEETIKLKFPAPGAAARERNPNWLTVVNPNVTH